MTKLPRPDFLDLFKELPADFAGGFGIPEFARVTQGGPRTSCIAQFHSDDVMGPGITTAFAAFYLSLAPRASVVVTAGGEMETRQFADGILDWLHRPSFRNLGVKPQIRRSNGIDFEISPGVRLMPRRFGLTLPGDDARLFLLHQPQLLHRMESPEYRDHSETKFKWMAKALQGHIEHLVLVSPRMHDDDLFGRLTRQPMTALDREELAAARADRMRPTPGKSAKG